MDKDFIYTYKQLVAGNNVDISISDFNCDTISILLDIEKYGIWAMNLGSKHYYMPFKEPYYYQWNKNFLEIHS